MQVRLLDRRGMEPRRTPHASVIGEAIGRSDFTNVDLIAISYLKAATALAQPRYFMSLPRSRCSGVTRDSRVVAEWRLRSAERQNL